MTLLLRLSLLLIILLSGIARSEAESQPPRLVKSLDTIMEIPEILAVSSSDAHLYVLSSREGLIVFRTHADEPKWLYTSDGLADRGPYIHSDIRFAYLFGTDDRLTIIEPTSLLGVYSSTRLGFTPSDVARVGNTLFLADQEIGIHALSLETSETVDTPPETSYTHSAPVVSLAATSRHLFALDNNATLLHFEYDNGTLEKLQDFSLPDETDQLFLVANRIYFSTSSGAVFRLRSDGRMDELFSISESVSCLEHWNNFYVIRGESKRVWLAGQGISPVLLRENPTAGNFITTFKNQLWMSDYRQFSRWMDGREFAEFETEGQPEVSDDTPETDALRLAPIEDQIIPYPRPLILPLKIEGKHAIEDILFQYASSLDGIHINKNGLYWQPSSSDIGTHLITIIATSRDGQSDSASFQVSVRPFNSPPRFTPIRPLSIPVNEPFSIPFRATDPDGVSASLVRYIGVDLPDGASIEEQTGAFSWTPSRRQTGEHEFQIIATDQYGAASSMNVRIQVLDVSREGS
ncbi:putative Ig domain-containing protein [Balneolaceae bacterium ANBcel3]|nr:putative Ig domain-containing protein [Balneolaceae bacterium ANBcel3]